MKFTVIRLIWEYKKTSTTLSFILLGWPVFEFFLIHEKQFYRFDHFATHTHTHTHTHIYIYIYIYMTFLLARLKIFTCLKWMFYQATCKIHDCGMSSMSTAVTNYWFHERKMANQPCLRIYINNMKIVISLSLLQGKNDSKHTACVYFSASLVPLKENGFQSSVHQGEGAGNLVGVEVNKKRMEGEHRIME